MMRAARRLAALAVLAAASSPTDATVEIAPRKAHGAASSWPALDKALKEYPAVHAREVERIRRGDPDARFLLVNAYHGLGNREHAVLSSFALALHRKAALFVDWPEQRCNAGATPVEASSCAGANLEDLFEAPPIPWTLLANAGTRSTPRVRVRDVPETDPKAFLTASWRLSHGTEWQLVTANLEEPPWNGSAVVRTDHQFLHAILCNERVAATGLFPPDALETQRALERYLLAPAKAIRDAARRALRAAGGCAVGVHLRRADLRDWRADDVYPRLRKLLKKHQGGLFVAADDYSAPFRRALEAAARADRRAVVEPPELDAPAKAALAENHILSACDVLVPSNASTFFNVASVRATERAGPYGQFACPRGPDALAASPLDGAPLHCRFRLRCGDTFQFERGSSTYKHGQVDDDIVQQYLA
mmetsp:Transcript_30340/g.90942  ORF Transcript_30340/g.90942 Transcript_30340/m.90942 type:complete len:420 (+) Transcript_30340:545-1804(+)